MVPPQPLITRHLFVHLLLQMLFLLTLHNGGGADGGEVLGVDGTVVIGETAGGSAEQITGMGLKIELSLESRFTHWDNCYSGI